MFKNLRLGAKIGLGFGTVLTLLSVVLAISILALTKADEGIEEYRGLARDTNLAGRLQANMLMVRMNVKDFLITKSDKDLEQYNDYLLKMKGFLQDAKQEIQKPERASLVSQVDSSIVTYEQAFDEVIKLIHQRNAVNDTRLVPSGEKMRRIIDEIIESSNDDWDSETVYHAGNVQEKMLVGRLFVVKFLQSNKESDFKVAVSNMKDVLSKEIEELYRRIDHTERRELLKEFEAAHQAYLLALHDIHDLIVKRNNIITNTLDVIGPKVAKTVEGVKLSVMKDQDTLGPELKANTDRSVQITIIVAIAAIVFGIGAAYVLTVSITRPIQQAVVAANQLAQGDLTVSVTNTSKDETGLLLDAVQDTANNLKQMISTISGASVELASSSEELAVVTEQTSQGIIQQEQETEMVATAMNEMTATVHDVADNASNTADAANKADNEATTGSHIVGQAITSIALLSENINQSSEKLSEVQSEVANITTILNIIREISDQTNLLALNAAIEAARAGEHGRGFAVVADEVRSLAARTQDSTTEIQNIIELLNSSTQSTVEVMTKGKEQADLCIDQASDANSALEAITNAIGTINDMSMQIASASEQQSTVAEDINKNVLNVKQIAEENAVASNQTRSSSAEIARLAESLNQLVAQFKV